MEGGVLKQALPSTLLVRSFVVASFPVLACTGTGKPGNKASFVASAHIYIASQEEPAAFLAANAQKLCPVVARQQQSRSVDFCAQVW